MMAKFKVNIEFEMEVHDDAYDVDEDPVEVERGNLSDLEILPEILENNEESLNITFHQIE